MRNVAGYGALGFERAVVRLEAALRERLPAPHRRLDPEEIKAAYRHRNFERGWRIDMVCSDGATRQIDLLVGASFPAGYPRTALVDSPGQLVWPHVEYDGVLCLLPIMAEVDAEDPGSVGLNLLGRSARLIEELIKGDIVERDFREEFLTYWFYARDGGKKVTSLIDPAGPSREVRVWRGHEMVIVGETQEQLSRWLANRFGKLPGKKKYHSEPAALVWLPQAPLPSEYPGIGADLMVLAEGAGAENVELLAGIASSANKDVLVLIGADGRGGPGLIAVTTTAAGMSLARHGRVEKPLLKGFTPKGLPTAVATSRLYSAAPVSKAEVSRADAAWIHGRGKDLRTPTLLAKTVTVIGCGSVGSSVAARLVRAGVGTSNLVDPDDLDWSNLGRHELGAGSIGKNKAIELAGRFQKDFPHLAINGHNVGAHALVGGYQNLLAESDLIVSMTGSWDAEGAINRWHVVDGRRTPIVYGWTESRAAAGHAVTIAAEGGCLRCGVGATGIPRFLACHWPAGAATIEEPACGNHFTPYGAVELGFVVDLVAEAALRALIDPPAQSHHDLWLAQSDRLLASGGAWSEAACELVGRESAGGRTARRGWLASDCPACSLVGDALIAPV